MKTKVQKVEYPTIYKEPTEINQITKSTPPRKYPIQVL